MTNMTRAEILETAKQYVTQDRAATHGNMEDNFQRIAEYWTVYLESECVITAVDVAAMMTLLKIARIGSNYKHIDNFVDACGYMACGGELAMRQHDEDQAYYADGDVSD